MHGMMLDVIKQKCLLQSSYNSVKFHRIYRKSFPLRDLRLLHRGGYYGFVAKSSTDKNQHTGVKIVAQNRAASYNYELLDSLEAGIVLVGTEVKTSGKEKVRFANLSPRFAAAKPG